MRAGLSAAAAIVGATLLGATLLGATVCAATASAQTVQVRAFEGRSASTIEQRVRDALLDAGLTVTEADADFRVEGRAGRVSGRWAAEVTATDARGDVVATERFASRRPAALARQAGAWARTSLVPAIQARAPAEEPAPAAERPPPRADAPSAPPPRERVDDAPAGERRAPNPLRFQLGVALTNRRLSYHDDIFGELRPYELPLWPYIRLGVEYFVGHHTPELDALWGLSFYADADFALGVSSRNENGATFPTTTWSLGLGARYGGVIDEVRLFGDVSYQTATFALSDADELTRRPDVANVEYHAIRLGAGVRWDVGFGFFFDGGLGYGIVLAAGEILSDGWFSRGDAGMVDGYLGLGQRVDDFEFRLRATYRRVFFSFNPQPGDARVAGGALDETFAGALDVAYTPSF